MIVNYSIMIIFIYGEDDFRAKKKISELKAKFLREIDPTGVSLSAFDGNASFSEIRSTLSTASLLSSKRMLVLEDAFASKSKDFLDKILEFLEGREKKETDDIVIVYQPRIKVGKKGGRGEMQKIDASGREKPLLVKEKKFFDFLSKQKFVQEFKKMSNADISSWIKKEARERGAEISIRAADELSSLSGGDLWQIDNEINKLINYKKGILSKLSEDNVLVSIEVGDVSELVKGVFDENIFALTDALSARNRILALKLLEEQYMAGLSDGHLLSMISRQVRILIGIRQALDSGLSSHEITSLLKLHPFVLQKGINQVRNFNLETLKKIFFRLVEIDKDMKTGRADARTALNILFSKI